MSQDSSTLLTTYGEEKAESSINANSVALGGAKDVVADFGVLSVAGFESSVSQSTALPVVDGVMSLDFADLPAAVFANLDAEALNGPDDGPRLQAALDFLAAAIDAGMAVGGELILPPGVFTIGQSLRVPDGIALRGAGATLADASDPGAGFAEGATVITAGFGFKFGRDTITDALENVDGANRDAYLLQLGEGTSTGVSISGIGFDAADVHGAMHARVAQDFSLTDSAIVNAVWSGARLYSLRDSLIENNVFHDASGDRDVGEGRVETGGAIYSSFAFNSVVSGNSFTNSADNSGSFGIKGFQWIDSAITFNTIDVDGFSIEIAFGQSRGVEIANNLLSGQVSIPAFQGALTESFAGESFYIHHNVFLDTYSIELSRDGLRVDSNVFAFTPGESNNRGNLFVRFGDGGPDEGPSNGPLEFTNNLVLNPGRGIFTSDAIINNLLFSGNQIVVTENGRDTGLFGLRGGIDFSTVEISNNIIEVIGRARDLLRNEFSAEALITNNVLTNVGDTDRYDNPQTGQPQGLDGELTFTVGSGAGIAVSSAQLLLLALLGLDVRAAVRQTLDADGLQFQFGTDGDDALQGTQADDVLVGGNGSDTFDVAFDGSADTIADYVAGEDVLVIDGRMIASGADLPEGYTARAVGGDVVIAFGDSSVRLVGADFAQFDNRTVITGTNGNDLLGGTERDDLISGGEGDDRLYGDGGFDELLGGAGDDYLDGRIGDDVLVGGDGNDTLIGDSGADVLLGGAGDDRLFVDADDIGVDGGDGWDRLFVRGPEGVVLDVAAASVEFVRGGSGNDVFDGADAAADLNIVTAGGDDVILGGAGNDLLGGQDGNDVITGGAGRDRLFGDAGDDALSGGDGDDVLIGGAGADILEGGAGNDLLRVDADDVRVSGGEGYDRLWVDDNRGVSVQLAAAGIENVRGGAGDDVFDARGADFDVRVVAAGGNDRLNGGDGDDLLGGQDGDDRIFGEAGNDRLYGDAGDDILRGGAGEDFLFGGIGDDDLRGEAGDDDIRGDAGDDLLGGQDGNDTLRGGDGNDRLFGDAGADRLYGGTGDDLLVIDADDIVIDGGDGQDTLVVRGETGVQVDLLDASIEFARGGNGDDVLDGSGALGALDIRGGNGSDTLTGGEGNDVVFGDGGDDFVNGGAGDDLLGGQSGDDVLQGGAGDDRLFGDDGADALYGGAGDDVLTIDADDRIVDGGTGYDLVVVRGNQGVTLSIVQSSVEAFRGNAGRDIVDGLGAFVSLDLDGGGGNDILLGGSVDDTLRGSTGDDSLLGNGGDDVIAGGSGDDGISGGAGADVLTGGIGADVFVFAAGDGSDVITDFVVGEDRLSLDDFASFGNLANVARQDGSDLVLDFGNGDTLTLVGVDLADFVASIEDILVDDFAIL